MPEGSLGSLFTEGWGCHPTWVVVCPGASQQLPDGEARFSQNGHLQRKALLLNIPESFAFNVLPSQQAMFTPVFPGCPPRTAVRFDPDFLWRPHFALGSTARESLCAPFKNGVSISPSPMELLHTSPTGLQCQML